MNGKACNFAAILDVRVISVCKNVTFGGVTSGNGLYP